mgnify:FL=1
MTAYDHQQWMKYMRRHEANVFNAIFYDKEEVTEDDIQRIIADVAAFFELPVPEINGKCESFAEVLLGDKAEECELSYNLEMLRNAGINNKDAFTLCFVHEMTHQLLYRYRFLLFCSERWMQELAADLTAGLYAERHHLATGKFKYALSSQKYSITHPNGKLRERIVECGRHYLEQKMVNGAKMINMVLQIMPSFVFTHKKELKKDWYQLLDELETPPQEPAQCRIEDLPDSNLIKQAVLKCKQSKA